MCQKQENEQIELPKGTLDRINDRVAVSEFDSVSEYIDYVLNEVLHHLEQEKPRNGSDKVDEQQVQDRLESLGYLNG
jgi:Arc/MetJ-type ribon-helix-helix transcriptional regulator